MSPNVTETVLALPGSMFGYVSSHSCKIIEVSSSESNRALVDVVGVRRHIDTSLLRDEPPEPGDWVLIHVGFAMSRISDAEAQDQLRILRLMGEDKAAAEEVQGYGMLEREPGLGIKP